MSQPSIDQQIEILGEKLRERTKVIADDMIERMRVEVPAFFTADDPDFTAAYNGSNHAHLGVFLDSLVRGRDLPATLPAAAVEETRKVAQWGISLEALVQTYRTGHAVIWEHAMDVAAECVEDTRVASKMLTLVSRYLFAYSDRMVALLTEVHRGEQSLMFHDRDRRRRQLVRDVLDGLPIDQAKLPYVLDNVHLAAVATDAETGQELQKIAARLRLAFLVVPGPSDSVWVWFGGARLSAQEMRDHVIGAVSPDHAVAFGDVAEGVEGFKITHREALQAHRIGRLLGRGTVQYGEVALLSLATRDSSLAREFMHRELGFLVEDGPRMAELRETVRVYFDSGHNASAAAGQLCLNDRTVAYRLRTVEEKLGRSLISRRDELSLALRLYELYADGKELGVDVGRSSDVSLGA